MKKQKLIEALQGVAIGDAFGVGIEFKSRLWMPDNIQFDRFVNVWKGGKNNIAPGTYSDDTEHTIGVLEALLSDEKFSEALLVRKFMSEYTRDKELKGFGRDGHGSIKDFYEGQKSLLDIRAEQASRDDPGNAPVMRAVPIGLIPFEYIRAYSEINSNSTHPNQVGVEAAYLTALLVHCFVVNDEDRLDVVERLSFLMRHYAGFADKLKEIDELPHPDLLTEEHYLLLHGEQPLPFVKWDTVYGLPCAAMKTALNAVYIMKHATNAFEALKYSILMGGDVDSLAAVCTGVVAGKYGLGSLPTFLLTRTEGLARLAGLGEQLHEKFW